MKKESDDLKNEIEVFNQSICETHLISDFDFKGLSIELQKILKKVYFISWSNTIAILLNGNYEDVVNDFLTAFFLECTGYETVFIFHKENEKEFIDFIS